LNYSIRLKEREMDPAAGCNPALFWAGEGENLFRDSVVLIPQSR
jgi:hypothetical protein